MAVKKIIIHCGAHKTATSSLQHFFSHNKEWLLDQGIKYINNRQLLPYFLRGELEDESVDSILISNESLFSYAGLPHLTPIYPTLKDGLKNFSRISSFNEVVLLFCVREPAYFVESLFFQDLGVFQFGSFKQTFEQLNFHNLDWLPVIRTIKEYSTPAQVNIFPYEVLATQGSKAYLELVLSLMGVKAEAPSDLPLIKKTLSQEAADKLMGSELISLSKIERGNRRKEIMGNLQLPYQRARGLSSEQRLMISNELRENNKRLFDKYLPGFNPSLWD